MEEMGIDYEIKKYERLESKLAPPELVAVHPTGKAPLITDTANGKNKVIAESGAIVEYLIRNYGNGGFVPADTERIDDESFFNHFAEGSLMPTLVMKLVFSIFPNQMPFYIRFVGKAISAGVIASFIDPDLKRKSDFIGDYLDKNANGGKGFFTGGDKDGRPVSTLSPSARLTISQFTDCPQYPHIDRCRLSDVLPVGRDDCR